MDTNVGSFNVNFFFNPLLFYKKFALNLYYCLIRTNKPKSYKMKLKATSAFIILLFITCSKENVSNQQKLQSSQVAKVTNALDTAKIPLDDLGTGTFMGSEGGLYPNGQNDPSGNYAADLFSISQSIVPIDTFGNPSTNKGRIVFISLGGSTCGHNMRQLKAQTKNNPLTNHKLVLLDCCNGYGEASLNSIMNPNDPYWDHVTQVLTGSEASYRSVQIIYLETDDSTKYINWPGRPDLVKSELESAANVLQSKFINLKVLYVLGRTRTFGNQTLYNREPSPYYFGWACKWTIEDQINGASNLRYKGPNRVAPIITWGFYQWADSLPRQTDGFYWRQSETKDGLHANPVGQDTLATRFQNFLFTDKNTNLWYAAH